MTNETKWIVPTEGENAYVKVVDQYGELVALVYSGPGEDDLDRRRRLIAASPALLGVVRALCIQLASAGIEAKADSLDPIAALHARALAAHEAATGDADPFGTALTGICAENRAALAARAPSDTKETGPVQAHAARDRGFPVCGALRGVESWQPTCSLPTGHDGPHRWEGKP